MTYLIIDTTIRITALLFGTITALYVIILTLKDNNDDTTRKN